MVCRIPEATSEGATIVAGAAEGTDPPVSRATYVLDRLRDDISQGILAPGEFLAQTELATRYGVSPTPVREALRVLEAEGAISYSPHKGATVTELSDESVGDHFALRAAVESLATRLSIERRGGEVGDRAAAIQSRMQEVGHDADPQQLSRLNRELHFALYSGASSLMTDIVSTLWRMLPQRHMVWSSTSAADVFAIQHDEIIQAARAGDAVRAGELMSEHVMTGYEEMMRAQPAD